MFWKLYEFLFYQKYLRNPWIWNVSVFPYFSRTMEILFRHVLGIVWISASPEIFKKSINLKCLCFLLLFLFYGNPPSTCFGSCMDFSVTLNIWGFYEFLHVLEVISISASPKIFKKSINLKYLCFSILSSYYGNPLFTYIENCINFSFTQNIWERHNFGMFVFSHTFSVL